VLGKRETMPPDPKLILRHASFSGLSIAHYLRKTAGLQSFVIYDKSERTEGGAGTWKENTVRAWILPVEIYG
jgi:hypothetical protein